MYIYRPLVNRCWNSNLHSSHYSWYSWLKRKCLLDSSYIEIYCSFGCVQKSGYMSRTVSAMDCWLGSAFCLRIAHTHTHMHIHTHTHTHTHKHTNVCTHSHAHTHTCVPTDYLPNHFSEPSLCECSIMSISLNSLQWYICHLGWCW